MIGWIPTANHSRTSRMASADRHQTVGPAGWAEPQPLEVDRLSLDPKNPRLAQEFGSVEKPDQEALLRILWNRMSVDEVALSIAANGYFPTEQLHVVVEDGRHVVVEGNRRLAAVKLLSDPQLCTKLKVRGLPEIDREAIEKLKTVPVVVSKSRGDVWQYIGYKHVNGPSLWQSYAKAHYVARVHNELDVPLEDIASTIGDRHLTVRRLYRGLMVLRQAESAGVWNRADRKKKRFAFSHLYTGLDYGGFQQFIGLDPDKSYCPEPVPAENTDKLGDLLIWLYGSKRRDHEPYVQSQNPDLRTLNEVVASDEGVAALRSGLPLDTAQKAARGDYRLLFEALVRVKQHLREALGLVVTGYDGSPKLRNLGREVVKQAGQLRQQIRDIDRGRRAELPNDLETD